ENIYNLDYKIAKDKEELEKLKNSFNELKLFFGYGFITGDFKDYYKNNFIFGASYSMFVYPSIARLGIDIRYQAVKAKEVATTKMTNYTFTPFLKIGYFFFSNDFLSNLYFYIRVGYGQNLTVLAVDSNEDVGLDSEYFAGFGVDYYLEKIICFIEGEYFVINGKEKKFKEIKVLSGFGLRF
ncbi:MAG TPA: hypothetical protein PK663_04730, partial [Spirochaetota bacterium]|nr:hypothetical protein [Spirochaetota bacterium]